MDKHISSTANSTQLDQPDADPEAGSGLCALNCKAIVQQTMGSDRTVFTSGCAAHGRATWSKLPNICKLPSCLKEVEITTPTSRYES